MVFAWSGTGHLVVDAVLRSDYPLALASATLSAAAVVAGRLAAEIVARRIDLRQRAVSWVEGTS